MRRLFALAALLAFGAPLSVAAQSDDETPVPYHHHHSHGSARNQDDSYASPAPEANDYRSHSTTFKHKSKLSGKHYTSEARAEEACGSDAVAWINTKSGAVHPKGDHYYGKTKHGAYICQHGR
jgi:hypothetical protein